MMKCEGAIFDLDGTLMDSMFIWDTIGADYLISRGIIPEPGLNEIFKNLSLHQAALYYQEHYGLTDTAEQIMDGVNTLIERLYAEEVRTKPGVKEVLKAFQKRGIPMCIATATDLPLVEASLRSNGIGQYFSGVMTCNLAGAGKDRPLIYEKALELLGTSKEQTWVFEDALYAVRTCKEAGFRVTGVYDKSSKNEWNEITGLADCTITSWEELNNA